MSDPKSFRGFYRSIDGPEDWKPLLAERERHWRTGYSAKTLAYCWQESGDFPSEVRRVFCESGIELFRDIEILLGFPEFRVSLPGGRRASQSDIFILAKGAGQLISIMVEGKVSEPFGDTIAEWRAQGGRGKETRLNYLCRLLGLEPSSINHIRYQLLHRTASALIEAQRFGAPNALMLVHSFSDEDKWFDDYQAFLSLLGVQGRLNSVVLSKIIRGVNLYLGWVQGDKKYLTR